MTSCRTTAVWLGTNNSQSVLVHPTFLSRMSATADHSLSHILPSSPACLRSAGSKLPMISQVLGIKSRSVWKDLQDRVERTIQDSATTTGPIQEKPFSAQLSSAFLIGLWGRCLQMTLWQRRLPWHHTWNDARRRWNSFSKKTFNDLK